MKLRIFTADETDELLNKFKLISNYTYSINNKAYNIMLQKYMIYMENFKPSLFHWRPKDFKYFTSKLNHYDNSRFFEWDTKNSYENFFRTELFSTNGTFLKDVNFHSCHDYYMHKYSNQKLTEEEKTILLHASAVIDSFFYNYQLHDKYRTLVKYAHRPFEFDETDIGWLENIEFFYNRALTWKSN